VILHAEFTVELLFVSGDWKRKITGYFTRGKEEGNIYCYDSVEITNKMQPCNRIYYSTVH